MKIQTIDWILYLIASLLVIFGVVTIYSITYGQEATRNYAYYQSITAIFGFIILIFLTILDYRTLKTIALPLYIISTIFLALLIFTPLGVAKMGATRWLNLGFIQFQPSELFKLVLIITLAKICDKKELYLFDFLLALFLLFLPVVLTIIQPDLGSAVILFLIGLSIILLAGFEKKYLYVLGCLFFIILIIFTLSLTKIKPFTFILKNYQKERILTLFNPQKDPFGSGYNISQSLIAIGSGGLFGRGLGFGPQSQLNFIPAKETDFIFPVAAEGFGFVGAFIMIFLFFVLFLRIIRIAQLSKDNFGTLLCVGILIYFLSQVFINIGMCMGLFPVTGVPLPFVSFGRTSLLVSLALIGICQSIMIRHKKITF